jgi:hypothetical protein
LVFAKSVDNVAGARPFATAATVIAGGAPGFIITLPVTKACSEIEVAPPVVFTRTSTNWIEKKSVAAPRAVSIGVGMPTNAIPAGVIMPCVVE